MNRKNLPISDSLIVSKAEEFGSMLGIIFKYLNRWLAGFKNRHHLKGFKIVGEARSISVDLVNAARERSKKVILSFVYLHGWHNVWNLDETGFE